MNSETRLLQDPKVQDYSGMAYESRERAYAAASIGDIYHPEEGNFGRTFDAMLWSGLAVIAKTLRADPRMNKEQALVVIEKALFDCIERHCATVNWAALDDYATDGLVPVEELMKGPLRNGVRDEVPAELYERAKDRAARADTEARRQARIRAALNMEPNR